MATPGGKLQQEGKSTVLPPHPPMSKVNNRRAHRKVHCMQSRPETVSTAVANPPHWRQFYHKFEMVLGITPAKPFHNCIHTKRFSW